MIDFHCHLDLYPAPTHVAEECERRRLYVLSVTTTPSAWHGSSGLARGRTRTALGLHPQLAHERSHEIALFDELVGTTRYVGEIGLDGSPEFRQYWEAQLEVFRHILKSCSQAGGRVLSIHSRRATKDVLDCLEETPGSGVPVLHWFSGSSRELKRAIELGCWFSVGPAMLSAKRGRSLVERMPRDRILTESDGPFAQAAGAPLYPWDVAVAVEILSGLWGQPKEIVEAALLRNLNTLVHGEVERAEAAPFRE